MAFVDLYGNNMSAPCRAILLTAKAIGVPINLKQTTPMTDDVKKPDFVKMNPQKTIPTMDDNGIYLNESRAIIQYLANKYAKSDKLYPKIPNERAIVDMRLYFDMGTLYDRFASAYYPIAFGGQPKFDENALKRLDEALEYLEIYVSDGYIAGSRMSIADFTVVASLSTIEAAGHDLKGFPKAREYLEKCKREMKDYEEINGKGAEAFGQFLKPMLDKARAS